MSSIADFNFSGDDPGPSTDPTADEIEEELDETNYKEPGAGESFLGNDPTVFDSEGNPDRPDLQKDTVVPIELEVPDLPEISNPVEDDVEQAVDLLINLGLKDYVLSTVQDERIETEPVPEEDEERTSTPFSDPEYLKKIFHPHSELQDMVDKVGDRWKEVIDFFVFQEMGRFDEISSLFKGNFWDNMAKIRAKQDKEHNASDDEEKIESGDDEGDIDEAQGSLSPDDSLEYIDINDWLDPLSPQNVDLEYSDLNDALQSVDMHAVDEYIDINDYMGDVVMESFLEEFMYVSQEEI